MNSFLKELETKNILTRDDIINIKRYINNKNSELDSKQKANILSHALYSIIDKSLKGFDEKNKYDIKINLVKDFVNKNSEIINKLDVLNTCIDLEIKSNEFAQDLTKWINKNIDNPITIEVINDYILNNSNTENIDTNSNTIVQPQIHKHYKIRITKYKTVFAIFTVLLISLIIAFKFTTFNDKQIVENNINKAEHMPISKRISDDNGQVYIHFKYKDVDLDKLKEYLKTRNSILCDEPYFSTLINTSKEYNLNPLILFSITGQEQGFVPKDNPYAKKIANNPFNVYESWQKYNTDITDSSRIATITIFNLLEGKPENINHFEWINRKYAEDKNWWKGVNKIYLTLEQICN